jgi:uncharacterized protein (DUF2252 family)
MRDAVQEFKTFNGPFALRNAELIRFKIKRMAAGPFAFFRGSFHLFASDIVNGVVELSTGDTETEINIVGDIHSENYGTFKAEDGQVQYDVNDFDETTRGRFNFDVARLATSFFLAVHERNGSLNEATAVVLAGVTAYADALQKAVKKGKSAEFAVSEARLSTCAPVDSLVSASAARRRTAFIADLTEAGEHGRHLRRTPHYFNLLDDERQRVERLLADYRKRLTAEPPRPDYYTVEDVCGRVSGIGSMGRYRYAVLLSGKSSAEGRNVLLEFKEARPSGYDLARNRIDENSNLTKRAAAVVAEQRQSQEASSGHLGVAVDGELSFQVRELGPADDRVDTKALKSTADLECVAQVQGKILARIHARAERNAVGPATSLADLSDPERFCQRILAFAQRYGDLVKQDFDRFTGAKAELEDIATWANSVSASEPKK